MRRVVAICGIEGTVLPTNFANDGPFRAKFSLPKLAGCRALGASSGFIPGVSLSPIVDPDLRALLFGVVICIKADGAYTPPNPM